MKGILIKCDWCDSRNITKGILRSPIERRHDDPRNDYIVFVCRDCGRVTFEE